MMRVAAGVVLVGVLAATASCSGRAQDDDAAATPSATPATVSYTHLTLPTKRIV